MQIYFQKTKNFVNDLVKCCDAQRIFCLRVIESFEENSWELLKVKLLKQDDLSIEVKFSTSSLSFQTSSYAQKYKRIQLFLTLSKLPII